MFQLKDPQTDVKMEQGPPTVYTAYVMLTKGVTPIIWMFLSA